MATKIITISLTEAQEWKLNDLQLQTGISRSGLMRKALLLLISELEAFTFPGGMAGADVTNEELEKEYAEYSAGLARPAEENSAQ